MSDSRRHAAKTTIVGGQPPGNARDLPPVPVGLEQTLHLAAASPDFADALLTHRERAVEASGLSLTHSERGMLRAVDDATLRQMIAQVDRTLAQPDRRVFLERATAAVALLVGGASLAGCDKPGSGGTAPKKKLPERTPDRIPRTTTGARVDRPDPPPAGIRPDRRRDAGTSLKPMGIRPDRRRERAADMRPGSPSEPVPSAGVRPTRRERPQERNTKGGVRPH